jgi:hypothetical protein
MRCCYLSSLLLFEVDPIDPDIVLAGRAASGLVIVKQEVHVQNVVACKSSKIVMYLFI